MTFAFDRLKTAGRELSDVSGSFDLDHGSLRLTGGRGGLPHHVPARLEGSIVFDPAAPIPYALKATAAIDEVDAAPFFAAPTSGEPAGVEGRFSVAGTITGSGINLADLIGRSQEEFRFTSSKNGGILRLLKTSVAEAIPQVSTPVKDAVGGVGSFVVGSIFGMKRDSLESNKNPISKNVSSAVLNFTDQIAEIGYDQITVTVPSEGSDGAIRLVQLAMTAPEECLTGSGQISSVAGLTLDAQPLSVDLQFGARGAIAELLQTAGLLSPVKDKLEAIPCSPARSILGAPWRTSTRASGTTCWPGRRRGSRTPQRAGNDEPAEIGLAGHDLDLAHDPVGKDDPSAHVLPELDPTRGNAPGHGGPPIEGAPADSNTQAGRTPVIHHGSVTRRDAGW